jgi:DNA repair protein RadA/Sms
VYAATVGGVRLTEPSVDLAIALSLASGAVNLSVPAWVVAFGEVGLAGEVRRVTGPARRLAEAERMGFRLAIVPAGSGTAGPAEQRKGSGPGGIEVREVADIREAMTAAFSGLPPLPAAGSHRSGPQGPVRLRPVR